MPWSWPCSPRPCHLPWPLPWPIASQGTSLQARFYGGAGGHLPHPPRFTCCSPPQIQKLADHSDMISEVPKCSKIQIFQGSRPGPRWGSLQLSSRPPMWWGGSSLPPAKNPTPVVGPSGLVSTGLRVQPFTELSTLLMIDFKCRPTGCAKKVTPMSITSI